MGLITDHRNALSGDIAVMQDGSPHKTLEHSLHVCPACGSSMVQPTLWERAGDRSTWLVGRRCPECEWACESVHSAAEIDAFDEQLELGAHQLAGELTVLEHANMREMVSSFSFALANDLIGADDFR